MNPRTRFTDTFTTVLLLLLLIQLTVGNTNDPGATWLIRAVVITPFVWWAWGRYRYRN